MTVLSKVKTQPVKLLQQSLEHAFPNVDPGEIPLGSKVLVQVKQAATKTKSGIVLTTSDIETEFDNTNIAKVISLGKLAYHTRDTMQPWPEGAWVKVGDYVRISLHNAKQWTVAVPGTRGAQREDRITFGLIEDLHIASIVNDPMAAKAFF